MMLFTRNRRPDIYAVADSYVGRFVAGRSRAAADSQLGYRAVYRIATNHSVAQWEVQERRVRLFGYFHHWEPVTVCSDVETAQALVNQLEFWSVIYPEREKYRRPAMDKPS